MIRAPAPAPTPKTTLRVVLMALPLCRCQRAHSRTNALKRAAAADVCYRLCELVVGRMGIAREQRAHGHDHARLAIAALRHLVLDPGFLHRGEAVRAQALD